MPVNKLRLNGTVFVAPRDELFDDLAGRVMTAAINAIAQRGEFHLALSGGSTPEPFYQHLVIDPRWRGINWEKTHLWMVDDRRVPADDDRYNYKMIRETLADHVPVRERNCHPMPVLDDDVAEVYEADLRRLIEPNAPLPPLDFILLGMGDDAHTASLFPHSDALHITDKLIAVNEGPAVTPPDRVTMTYPLINAAREVVVLITGERKAPTLERIDRQLRTDGPDIDNLPITGVNPIALDRDEEALMWLLDPAAAGE